MHRVNEKVIQVTISEPGIKDRMILIILYNVTGEEYNDSYKYRIALKLISNLICCKNNCIEAWHEKKNENFWVMSAV